LRLVVFGWGNESRGDDGLGPLLLSRLAEAAWPDVVAIEDYQLQIEHALDLEGADCALFIDAGKGTKTPFTFQEIAPRTDIAHTTHALAPEAVLAVFARIKKAPPPPAFVLCVRGESFELGEGLSKDGKARLEAAWNFLSGLLQERSLAAWRRRSFEFRV
jgi:hydrogenase maturation protease